MKAPNVHSVDEAMHRKIGLFRVIARKGPTGWGLIVVSSIMLCIFHTPTIQDDHPDSHVGACVRRALCIPRFGTVWVLRPNVPGPGSSASTPRETKCRKRLSMVPANLGEWYVMANTRTRACKKLTPSKLLARIICARIRSLASTSRIIVPAHFQMWKRRLSWGMALQSVRVREATRLEKQQERLS